MKKLLFSGLMPIMTFAFLLTSCQKQPNNINAEINVNAAGEVTIENNPTIDATIKNGIEVSIIPEKWNEYYLDFKANHNYQNVTKYYTAGAEDTKPVNVELSWSNSNSNCLYYVLYLSNTQDMGDAKTFFTIEPTYSLSDLFAGTRYYYQIHAYYEEYTTISRKFDFKTVDFMRAIDIDGVQSARDLGNKYTVDGSKRIKQGMLYRSGALDKVSEKGKHKAINVYNIKTDLDLREVQSNPASPLGVNYISNAKAGTDGSPYYAGKGETGPGLDSTTYQPTCRDNLKVFANQNNYPIIFHCSVGRDRTGTLAILLQLLCGIDLELIKVDYVAYLFSSLTNGFDLNRMNPSMMTIFDYLSTYVSKDGTDNGTIYERTERYCLDIGVNEEEISSIRNILLEEVSK